MTKLTTLKPGLSTLPNALAPSHATEGERSRYRDATQPYRAWYRTARWYRLRWQVLTRDLFTCQWPGCGRLEGNTRMLVAHHKRAHHGNPVLFWSEANLTTLCKLCHDKQAQAKEATARLRGEL